MTTYKAVCRSRFSLVDELQVKHPQRVAAIREQLDVLFPSDAEEDELWA